MDKIDFLGGQLTDHYKVEKTLGHGGYSIVREGVDLKTGERVALKTLKTSSKVSKLQVALLHELTVLKRVNEIRNHNLMKFHGAHREPPSGSGRIRYTIITQLCSGGELFDRIVQAGNFNEQSAASVTEKLARALQDLHASAIVHRDLKPENILYLSPDKDAEPVLADFGLAKLLDSAPVNEGLIGTLNYLAPEVISKYSYTPACDVWSLGVILYIMLAGYPPFHEADRPTLFAQICRGNFAFHQKHWSRVSEQAKDLVRRLLIVDPAKRLTLKELLSHPWITRHTPRPEAPFDADHHKRLRVYSIKRRFKAAAFATAFGAQRLRAAKELRHIIPAQLLSPIEFSVLSAGFRRACAESGKSGEPRGHTLTLDSFRRVLASCPATAALPASELFELLDNDGSGDIDAREFLLGLARITHPDRDITLRACFDLFDEDENGFLTLEEVANFLETSTPFYTDDAPSPTNTTQAGDSDVVVSNDGSNPQASVAQAQPPTAVAGAGTSKVIEGDDRASDVSQLNITIDDRRFAIAERIAQAFSAMDTNADGMVSFEEFKKAVFSDPMIAEVVFMPISDGSPERKSATISAPRGTGDDAAPERVREAAAEAPPAGHGVAIVRPSSSRLWCCCF